jgi:hypothetical protein
MELNGNTLWHMVQWILRPYIKIRLRNAIGIDGISRPYYCYTGIVWEWHSFGYWQLWYDGPIHHFSLGFMQLYWDCRVD